MAKRSSLAAVVIQGLLCVSSALAAEADDSFVDSVCRIVDSSALAQHLPSAFLTGLIWQESKFRPDAVSPVGARGIAQFMPVTAADRGLANPDDPVAAIPKAAELLAILKQRFGNLGLAAAAYNAGATRVASWLAGAGELPPETRDYVKIVTRHPLEDWSGLSAAGLTDDAVFPGSSCLEHIALLRRVDLSAGAASPTPLGAQISSSFSKGAAMWSTYASALNAFWPQPIQRIYDIGVSELRLDLVVCAGAICLLLAYVGKRLKNLRDELRRNKTDLEAVLRRGGAIDPTSPLIRNPAPAPDGGGLLRAERAERPFEAPGPRLLRPTLARFGHQDRATTDKLLDPFGGNGAAAEESALETPASTEPATPDAAAEQEASLPPPQVGPFADPAYRAFSPQPGKTKARALKPVLAGIGLTAFATCGAFAIYASPPISASAYLGAITGSTARDEERAAMRDLAATVVQATARLDRIEHDEGARLDELRQRMSQDSPARLADISARLETLEQKAAAAPPAPDPGLTDLAARLDKLEKKTAVASAAEAADGGPKLDKADKKAVVTAANSPGPPPSTLQQQAMLAARAGGSASNDIARSPSARPLLQEYRVEDVRGGVAVIGSRYGQQRASVGDLIPGAGRVLGIERQGGGWFVVTSLGVIASGPAPR